MKKHLTKKTILITVALIAISIFLISIIGGSNTSNSIKLIPKDALVVASLDFISIAKKADLMNSFDEMKMFKLLKRELKNESRRMSKKFDSIMDDPTQTGISFTSDFNYFMVMASDDDDCEPFQAVTFDLTNGDQFSDFLDQCLKLIEIDNDEYDKENEDNYEYLNFEEGEVIIAWDNEKAIFLITPMNYRCRAEEEAEDLIDDLFTMVPKENIRNNKSFKKFIATKKDLSVFLSTEGLQGDLRDEMIREFRGSPFDYNLFLDDNSMAMYLNFDEGNISLLYEVSLNKDLQEILNKYDIFDNNFNSKLIQLFPEESFSCASMSINLINYFEAAKSLLDDQEMLDEVFDQVQNNSGYNFEEILGAIEGNAIFNIFGVENMTYSYLDWGYEFNLSDATKTKMYGFDQVGYLTSEQIESLNDGKTIKSPNFPNYSVNILNILEKDQDVSYLLKTSTPINWYTGGMSYGRNTLTETTEILPLIGFAFDINNKEIFDEMLNLVNGNGEEILKKDNYYTFSFDNRYPTYLALNDEIVFISNDEDRVIQFSNNKIDNNNLNKSNISDNIKDNNMFAYMSLDYDNYPSDLRNEFENELSRNDRQIFDLTIDLLKSVEFKAPSMLSTEYVVNFKNEDDNALNVILQIIDINFTKLNL